MNKTTNILLAGLAIGAVASLASAQTATQSAAALLSDAAPVHTHVEARVSQIVINGLEGLFVAPTDDAGTNSSDDSATGDVAYGTAPSSDPGGVDPMQSGGGNFAFDVFGVDLDDNSGGNTYDGGSKPNGRTVAAPMPSPLTMTAAGLFGVGLISRRRA